jgi:hypothetical protein
MYAKYVKSVIIWLTLYQLNTVVSTVTAYMGMPVRRRFAPGFVNYKKGVLDSQPQVIKLTSYLPMFGGSLHVLRLLPPLKLVAMI